MSDPEPSERPAEGDRPDDYAGDHVNDHADDRPEDTDDRGASARAVRDAGTAGRESGGGATGKESGGGTDGDATAATTVDSETRRRTNHWVGAAAVSFLTAGVGVLVRSRPLLLASALGVVYLAYANVSSAPTPSLSVTRALADPSPEPGDRVDVRVTVENTGSSTLPDLRAVEQVPDALAVVDGPARASTALRPGAAMTFSYTVLARRGEYDFDGMTVLARNASGSEELAVDLSTPAATLTCVPPPDATETVPLRALTTPYTGRVPTDTAGEGVEFASLREYQTGDPLSRLDWNRYARDGTLTTMEFREERMATVVVLLDLRVQAYVQAGSEGRHAVDRAIDATHRIFNSLLDTGDRVGIAALSPVADVWVPPGAGPTHQATARHLLATHPALSPTPPTERLYARLALRRLAARLSDDAQVVFCSPMADDAASYVARSLQARDRPVTVVSPDPTSRETVGGTLAAVRRSNRLHDLRRGGLRVVDWADDESLLEAIECAGRRWSA
jgi:uncharacterized protein (DUF58 family)